MTILDKIIENKKKELSLLTGLTSIQRSRKQQAVQTGANFSIRIPVRQE